ncbi:hypothetical protein evm_011955 [Chilo suppressalis]|nr:hypothetical protein evm_011955 [Chilo suppressalis]
MDPGQGGVMTPMTLPLDPPLSFLVLVMQIEAIPVDTSEIVSNKGEETMDTAESQNPFLPRFAMRILKERRLRAQAQRRNNPIRPKSGRPQADCRESPYRRWYHNQRK